MCENQTQIMLMIEHERNTKKERKRKERRRESNDLLFNFYSFLNIQYQTEENS